MNGHNQADWLDVPLIADDKTCDYVNKHDDEITEPASHPTAIVLSDEHLYMWNMAPDEIRLKEALHDIKEIRHPFWVDERAIAHILPDTPLAGAKCNKRKYPTDNIIVPHAAKKRAMIMTLQGRCPPFNLSIKYTPGITLPGTLNWN